jgi:hypothetical protein
MRNYFIRDIRAAGAGFRHIHGFQVENAIAFIVCDRLAGILVPLHYERSITVSAQEEKLGYKRGFLVIASALLILKEPKET